MKDRVPTYPGRVRLVPVSGQTDVFDLVRADEPTEEGTALSKANILTDTTAALYGLGENATPDQVLATVKPIHLGGTGRATASEARDNLGVTGVVNAAWKLLTQWTAAGSYTWTAPDLNNGSPYKIGVLIKGGGGSGAVYLSTSNNIGSLGGASGRTLQFTLTVTPGTEYSLVVGSGGARVTISTLTTTGVNGNNGNSSSFSWVSCSGGEGGKKFENGVPVTASFGAQSTVDGSGASGFDYSVPPFGGIRTLSDLGYKTSISTNECINLFTAEPMMGAGGSVYYNSVAPSGKSPITGLGGGDAAAQSNANAIAADADAPGCGGGGAVTYNAATIAKTVRSGAGADGEVSIYIMGVDVP